MTLLSVPAFGGEKPKTTPRLLQATDSTLAINCSLETGSLKPLRGCALVQELDEAPQTIFKHDVDGWLTWDKEVDVVKSAIYDAEGEEPLGQLFITGDKDYPTFYLAGGYTYRLGIPRPESALTLEVLTAEDLEDEEDDEDEDEDDDDTTTDDSDSDSDDDSDSDEDEDEDDEDEDEEEDVDIDRSTSYVYTYVQSLADGVIQYESANSPATDVVDVEEGGGVKISGFVIPELEDLTITAIRIYRTVSSEDESDFRFLVELTIEELEELGWVYTDTIEDADVSSEVLATSTWDAIPDEALGLHKCDNGIYVAYRGNEILLSEPFIPYAFPESYMLLVEDSIVGFGHTDQSIICLTTGRPYGLLGTVPESLSMINIPLEQSCVSKRSISNIPGGVLYASPDGIMMMTSSDQEIITKDLITREQWQELDPTTLLGTVLDNRYVGFFKGSNHGLIIDIGRMDIVRIELPDDWEITCMYHHSEDDCIYLGIDTDDGAGIYQFEAGDYLTYTWRSKEFFSSRLTSMSAARISGEHSPANPVTMKIFGPDKKRPRDTLKLTGGRTARIKPTRSERNWMFELSGTAEVYEAKVGGSVLEVEASNVNG